MVGLCEQNGGRAHSKDILYGELASGKRNSGRPQLRFKDACERNMKALDINTKTWEDLASNRSDWRITLRTQKQVRKCWWKRQRKSVHAEKMLCGQTNKPL